MKGRMDTAPFTLSLSKGEANPLVFVLRRAQHERALTKGFTLIELTIGFMLMTIGIVALWGALLSGLLLVEASRSRSQAAADARVVFEEMRRQAGTGLATVTGTNWANWVASANGGNLTNTATRINPPPLKGETIAVTLTDLNGGPVNLPADDPFRATVRIDWQEKARAKSATFTALLTRR